MSVDDGNVRGSLWPISDRNEVAQRYEVLNHAVHLTGDRKLNIVRRQGWVAVPQDHGLPSSSDARQVAALCQREDRDRLWGLALEWIHWKDSQGRSQGVGPHVIDVAASREVIESFSHKVSPRHYALLPEDASWVIISVERDDWQIVMGRPAAVADILGRPIPRAYEDYALAAERHRRRSADIADRTEQLLHQLRDEYPRMEVGGILTLEAEWATWNPSE